MKYTPERGPESLPFDSSSIRLGFSSIVHPLRRYDSPEVLTQWGVTVTSATFNEEAERYDTRPIGQMSFTRVNAFAPVSAWKVADGESGELEGTIAACVEPESWHESGLDYTEEFQQAAMVTGDLLVLEHVSIEPQCRGFGLEALAAAEAIHRLGAGCAAVACVPASLGDFATGELWESVGFSRFKGHLYLLSMGSMEKDECRDRWASYFSGE